MKLTTVVIMTVLAVTFFAQLVLSVMAVPITLFFIDPDSGPTGTIATVYGEIATLGGPYQIWWDGEILLKEGICSSGSLEVYNTFTVPSSSEGFHDVYLIDVTANTQSAPVQFVVVTSQSYTLLMEPARIQEGFDTTITVGMREAAANENFTFTMIVTTPTTAIHTANLTVTTDEAGFGTVSKTYWGEFPGANTHLVGTYNVAINASVATGSFTVGLTNKLVYGMGEPVFIQGAGYYPNESVTINIEAESTPVAGYPKNITANVEGVLTDSWHIPIDAATGTYIVTLVSAAAPGTIKELPDIQELRVMQVCQIQTQNLDDEPVAGVTVEVYDAVSGDFLLSEKTNKTGWALFKLETGNYTFKAFWMNVFVGSLSNQTLIGKPELILECHLARVRMAIKDETNVLLPLIDIRLTYNYTTRNGENLTRTHALNTNFSGTVDVMNLFTNINYAIEARRDGLLFDTTRIANLTSTRWINITCPIHILITDVLDSKGIPIQNAQIKVYEWNDGLTSLVGEGNTDDRGRLNFALTFGKYRVRVYKYSSELGHTVLLNETVVNLIEDQLSFAIHCTIFNLKISVKVVDYLGEQITHAAVKVERKFEQEYIEIANLATESNGTVQLPKIGGDYRISVSVGGRLAEVQVLRVDESMEIPLKIDRYVAIGGHSLETPQVITLVFLGLLSASFVLMLTYRRLLLFLKRVGVSLLRKVRTREKG